MKILDYRVGDHGPQDIVSDTRYSHTFTDNTSLFGGRPFVDFNNSWFDIEAPVIARRDFCLEIVFSQKDVSNNWQCIADLSPSYNTGLSFYVKDGYVSAQNAGLEVLRVELIESTNILCIARVNSELRVYLNGVFVMSAACDIDIQTTTWRIGAQFSGVSPITNLSVYRIRIWGDRGVARVNTGEHYSPDVWVHPHCALKGSGRIAGKTKQDNKAHPNTKVSLFQGDTWIASVFSDNTGGYEFTGIKEGLEYWMRFESPDPTWENLIKSRVIPV